MFNETSFPVRTAEVMRLGLNGVYEPITGVKAIINGQTDQVLSVMSKDYVSITDVEIMDRVLEITNAAGIEVIPVKHHLTRSKDGVIGRTTYMEVELPQYSLFPDTPEHQRVRFVIPNSYNGTLQLRFIIMFYRQVCSNGMMGWRDDFNFAFKHREGALNKFSDALNLYLTKQLSISTQMITDLQQQESNTTAIVSYLQNNKILSGQRWADKLMGKYIMENTPTNLWSLYNIFTNLITHSYGRNFGPKMNKLSALNHEVQTTWARVLA